MAAAKGKNVEELEHLDEKIAKVDEFLKLWLQFERMMRDGHHKVNLTQEMEARFLQLKSHCARAHQYLMELLANDYIQSERITSILSRCVTLRQLSTSRDENYFNIQHDWQLRYLHLQESLISLQYKRDQIA